MEEEGGEEDSQQEGKEKDGKKVEERESEYNEKGKVQAVCKCEDRPEEIPDCSDCYVNPSKSLAEDDSGIVRTKVTYSRESKVGNRWEDNEGGVSVEDLERGFISEVHSGEEREDYGVNIKHEQGEGQGQLRDTSMTLVMIVNSFTH